MKIGEDLERDAFENNPQEFSDDRISIMAIKYFWQASPLARSRVKTIPKFLRRVDIFENFSENELRVISKFLHSRSYTDDEIIIKEGKNGFGFYLLYDGKVDVYTKQVSIKDNKSEYFQQYVTELETYEYFGEFSLLEKHDKRNATIMSKGNSTLLVIYKPDLEELIKKYPVVGAKFLQAIAMIISRRFLRVAESLKNSKKKIRELESALESKNS